MRHRNQRLRPGPRPLWKRILERYRFKGSLLPARVPLVLFRAWSANTYRQAHRGLRSTVAQYPLTLKFQFFCQQSINKESRPRAQIERSIFTQSVTKELRQAWLERDRTTRSAERSNLTARPPAELGSSTKKISVGHRAKTGAASALPVEPTGPLPSSDSPQITHALYDVRSQVGREQKTISPKTFRTITEKVFRAHLHTFVAERNVLTTSSARGRDRAYRPKGILAGDEASSPIVLGTRITRTLRRNVDLMFRDSVLTTSRFIHPEQAEGDGKISLPSVRSRLFAQSALLNLASPAAGSARSEPQGQTSVPPAPAVVQPSQPTLDIGRLSDEVYRHIQKKVRVERERRGM